MKSSRELDRDPSYSLQSVLLKPHRVLVLCFGNDKKRTMILTGRTVVSTEPFEEVIRFPLRKHCVFLAWASLKHVALLYDLHKNFMTCFRNAHIGYCTCMMFFTILFLNPIIWTRTPYKLVAATGCNSWPNRKRIVTVAILFMPLPCNLYGLVPLETPDV